MAIFTISSGLSLQMLLRRQYRNTERPKTSAHEYEDYPLFAVVSRQKYIFTQNFSTLCNDANSGKFPSHRKRLKHHRKGDRDHFSLTRVEESISETVSFRG